jgi:hypothetical protein
MVNTKRNFFAHALPICLQRGNVSVPQLQFASEGGEFEGKGSFKFISNIDALLL